MEKSEKKRCLLTFCTALCVGLLAHLFGMVNVLQSGDAVITIHGTGAGLTSGRWMLEIFNRLPKGYWPLWNLNYFNNFLALIILAASACLIVKIFSVEDPWLCAAWGGIFVSFPSVTATFLFAFASVYYAAAVFMTVYSVYITDRYKYGFIPAALLSAAAMGIYQAYFPVMISLFLSLLIMKAVDGSCRGLKLLKRAFFYLGTLILSLVFYFVILKIMLAVSGIQLSGYMGIDSMGKLSLSQIPGIVFSAYHDFMNVVVDSGNQIVNTELVRNSIFILGIISAAIIFYVMLKEPKRIFAKDKGILLVFLILYPLGLCSIKLMCYSSMIHTLMTYSMVFIFMMPIVLVKYLRTFLTDGRRKKLYKFVRVLVIVVLCLVCLNYCMQSNAVYTKLYFERIETESYWTAMLAQVKNTPGFSTELPWAFIGFNEDETVRGPWSEVPYRNVGAVGYSRVYHEEYIMRQLGYNMDCLEGEELLSLADTDAVKSMPVYPDYGSIQIIDDTVVIKLSDEPMTEEDAHRWWKDMYYS